MPRLTSCVGSFRATGWVGILLACLAAGVTSHAVPPAPPSLPANPEMDKTYPLRAETGNRAVRLTVFNGARVAEYGPLKAADGRSLLVLSTEWENTIAMTLVREQKVDTAYKIPNLADNLYLVADGRRVYRMDPRFGTLPGHVPTANFLIDNPGEAVRGNLIFDIPAGPVGSLELRFYDNSHGHMACPLGPPIPAAVPLAPPQKNEVVAVAVYGAEHLKELKGRPPTPGVAYVSVDLRAASRFTTDGDATAFDPKAKPGTKAKVVTIADWRDARKYLQLLVDGEYARSPLPESDLPEIPRFLPDVFTGGNVVFAVPERFASLELRCDFPNAAVGGRMLRPAGLVLAVEGKRPQLPQRKSIVGTKDAVFDVAVVGQSTADEFAGAKAAGGMKFLVLDVVVKNLSPQAEFFQSAAQLKHVGETGTVSPPDAATWAGTHAPPELVYIPANERRTFQVVYAVPAGEARPRLSYAAVTAGASKVLDLPAADAPADASAGTPSARPPAPPPLDPPSNPPRQPLPMPETVNPPVAARPNSNGVAERVTARQDRPARGLAGVGLTAEQVNAAIDKASKALWELIRDEDLKHAKFGGRTEHALAALAMVHAGAHKKIPEFDAALRGYLALVKPHTLGVYQAGVVAMLVEAYGDTQFAPKLEDAARYLLESQGVKGTWTYTPRLPEELFTRVEEPRSVIRVSGGVPLDRPGEPWNRTTAFVAGTDGDNSVTQYALLGLNTASRSGAKVAAAVWKSALKTARDRQNADGGWAYTEKGSSSYGSMTAAGVCAVALCRHELGESEPFADESVERGLGWLAANFSVGKHPASDQWLYYYLYSVERVGRVLDTEFIGPHEWYPLGAAHILGAQKATGLWTDRGQEAEPRLASSFALLFLTRATPALDLKRPRGGPGTLRTAALAPFQNFYVILDASGSMLDEMDGKQKFDIARESVRALVDDLPANCNVALRVYGHRKRAIENGSDEDSELKIPMTPLDKKKFGATLDALRPRGKTPLAFSLEAAVKDLGKVDPEKPVTLLLLTDGGEDTTRPRRDPLKSAELLGQAAGVRFHVVGFDINQPDWTEQLIGIAERGGGRYWPAAKAADLERGLRAAVLGVPEEYAVSDPTGREVTRTAFGAPVTLPEGKYRFRTTYAGSEFDREFWVNAGSTTSVTFDASRVPRGSIAVPAPPATRPAVRRPEPVTEAVKRFCTQCGTALKSGAKFCEKCGAKVPEAP